jgi:hydrogenase nickel incorporation protein HypA/HybF
MHEFSCAQSLAKAIKKVCQKYQINKIYKINLRIGVLTLINKEQLIFWLREGLKEILAEENEINAIEEQPEIECKNCGYCGNLKPVADFFYILCPRCNSSKIIFKKGNDYYLESIEGE